MEIFINGDIYLKREPEITDYSIPEIEELRMQTDAKIGEIEAYLEQVKNGIRNQEVSEEAKKEIISKIDERFEKRIEELKQETEELIEKGKANYENGYKSFWLGFYDEKNEKIRMVEKTNNKNKLDDKTYNNVEEMSDDFISLREILTTAKFQGTEFMNAKNAGGIMIVTIHSQNGLMVPGPILTHEFGDRGIVYRAEDLKNGKYEIVITKEFYQNTFGIVPNTHYEFEETSAVYKNIAKQLIKSKTKEL